MISGEAPVADQQPDSGPAEAAPPTASLAIPAQVMASGAEAPLETSASLAAKVSTTGKSVESPLRARDDDGTPRIGALGPHVWIRPKPQSEGLAVGKMRRGTSIRLRSTEPVPGAGCAQGWRAVEPSGYVCLNSHTTLDLTDPYYIALNDVAPRFGVVWPYRYAHSRGAPMYSRVPTPEEWKKVEAPLGPPGTYLELGEWAAGHEEMIDENVRIEARDEVPWYFEGGRRHVRDLTRPSSRLVWKHIPNGSMLSYAKSFEQHGRVWLLSPDLTIVPADRVQHMRRSVFRGVQLGGEAKLPLAWNRGKQNVLLYRKNQVGAYVASGESLAPKQHVMVTGKRRGLFLSGYYPLRDRPELFIKAEEVTIAFPREKLPNAIKPGEKWIDASIHYGTLTAYIGLEPVYSTLFSAGKGGQPVPQTGYFRYEWKEWVATMSNEKGDPKVLWFSDVPHVQYVKAPLAQHVAYWHEDYGNLKSAECLNMSPADGRWLFSFTDPPVPKEWGAVGANFGQSTIIMINGF